MKSKDKVGQGVIHQFPDRKTQITHKVKKFKHLISNTNLQMGIN